MWRREAWKARDTAALRPYATSRHPLHDTRPTTLTFHPPALQYTTLRYLMLEKTTKTIQGTASHYNTSNHATLRFATLRHARHAALHYSTRRHARRTARHYTAHAQLQHAALHDIPTTQHYANHASKHNASSTLQTKTTTVRVAHFRPHIATPLPYTAPTYIAPNCIATCYYALRLLP